MNLITRNTDYAIRALSNIAKRKKETISVSDLVKDLKIPRPFLRKILQELNKNGILKSYKGKGGGFMLRVSPHKLRIGRLIEVFQGPIRLRRHFFKKGACPNIKTCFLKKKLDVIEKELISKLDSITIACLMEGV